MLRFPCAYLNGEVELTDERAGHIAASHPDLLPRHMDPVARTLADPDLVRRSERDQNARLLSPWFPDLRGGRRVVTVVVSSTGDVARHWVVTAYSARRLTGGTTEWQRN